MASVAAAPGLSVHGRPAAGPVEQRLAAADPEMAAVLAGEVARRTSGLRLLASANVMSPTVRAVLGSALADCYAEGYPGRRHHPGCEAVDRAEELGRDRARRLLGADHANLQPHSGTSAALAAYAALMRPGGTMLALSLAHGGHLVHGGAGSFSGSWFRAVHYGVRRDDERVDMDEVRDLALRHRPQVLVAGGTADPRVPDWPAFRAVADEVGAWLVADAAQTLGLAAGGAAPSPVPWADVVVATTHKVLRGPHGGLLLCRSALADRVDRAVHPFTQGGPVLDAVAAKAVALGECLDPAWSGHAAAVLANARTLVAALAAEGLRPVTGGTDTALGVLDVSPLRLTGAEAAQRCAAVGLTLQRSAVPYDPLPPTVASGVRLGTAAVTAQGLGTADMEEVAVLLARTLRDADPAPDVVAAVRALAARATPVAGG